MNAIEPITTHLLYLHGFRSSPHSVKAQKMAALVAQRFPAVRWWCPQLPPSPQSAMRLIEDGIGAWKLEAGFKSLAVVGSSLGGFYATAVAERHGCKAVLINPAVCPARDLARYIGEQTTWLNSNERFFFAPHYVDELIALQTGPIRRPMLYYPIIAKGDEVLDWREMAAYYAKANVQLLDGGDHALSDFDLQAPGILQFLALKEGPALQDCD